MAETRLIPLTRGKFAVVDAEDFAAVSQFKWRAQKSRKTWYARRTATVNGKETTITLHVFLCGSGADVIDHRDGDGLNNTRRNLRPATTSQNLRNCKRSSRNKTGYKGVYRMQRSTKFAACLQRKHLGSFSTPEEAHEAYKKAAKELYGEFARFN